MQLVDGAPEGLGSRINPDRVTKPIKEVFKLLAVSTFPSPSEAVEVCSNKWNRPAVPRLRADCRRGNSSSYISMALSFASSAIDPGLTLLFSHRLAHLLIPVASATPSEPLLLGRRSPEGADRERCGRMTSFAERRRYPPTPRPTDPSKTSPSYGSTGVMRPLRERDRRKCTAESPRALGGEPAADSDAQDVWEYARAIGGSHGRPYLFVRLGVSGPNRSPALCQNCVTFPPKPRSNTVIYGDTSDAYQCCGKSLIGSALVGFGVRQHARAESISKRAPSTTRTSLRVFRISSLQASG